MQNPYQPPGNPPPPPQGWGGYGYPQQQPFGAPGGVVPFGAASANPLTAEEQLAAARVLADREIADYAMYAIIGGIASMFCFGFIFGWFALHRGNRALKLIQQHNLGHQHATKANIGRGLGVASIVLWTIGFAAWIIVIPRM